MKTHVVVLVLLTAVAGLAAVFVPTEGLSQEQKANVGVVSVHIEGGVSDQFCTVTLLREGRAIAAKDLRVGNKHRFENLPFGAYDVSCESARMKSLVKKAFLRADDKTVELTFQMQGGEGTFVFGAGTSVDALEARVKKLEAAVAKLRGK